MGISELRHLRHVDGLANLTAPGLAEDLVRRGVISETDAGLARLVQKNCDTSMDRILVAEGLVSRGSLLDAHARRFKSRQLGLADLEQLEPIDCGIAPQVLLSHAVLPVSDRDGLPAVVVESPTAFAALVGQLPDQFLSARVLWARRDVIQSRIAQLHREVLTQAAMERVPEIESCRSWGRGRAIRLSAICALLALMVGVVMLYPAVVFTLFAGWAIFTLFVSTGMKTAAFVAHRVAEPEPSAFRSARAVEPMPKVSILVPLFRETEVLHALVSRLSRLTYPKSLLDVLLVVEEEDDVTREMLATIDLPPWIRPIVVPDGQPRTKPRAMNYALDFCEGDIVGVYDAEDAPDPDQLTQVARFFQKTPLDVACVQGILDYYNPRQNWLARCFTIEYATWFRLILPGMARLGFAIPLGGTTLFFRRSVLEELGGWDAHNVTEDADLGFRLARHGYRTEMLATVTEEEANCLPWAWVRQRSRWLKGYMTTYIVHMRRPGRLWRQLGSWKFLGFQAHFLTALSQFTLAPILWSFWLVLLGLPHPLDPWVAPAVMTVLGSAFLAIEVVNLTLYASAVSGRNHRHLLLWTPTMHFYTPLGTIAAYKALYELIVKPFFWDKTTHGLSIGKQMFRSQRVG